MTLRLYVHTQSSFIGAKNSRWWKNENSASNFWHIYVANDPKNISKLFKGRIIMKQRRYVKGWSWAPTFFDFISIYANTQSMANPYKQGMSGKRSQGGGTSQNDGTGNSNNNMQRERNTQVAQSPARSRSLREQKSTQKCSPEMSEISENTRVRRCSPSRRPTSNSWRLTRASSVSPSRLPPTMTNPEGRGRKLPATPIRYVNNLAVLNIGSIEYITYKI